MTMMLVLAAAASPAAFTVEGTGRGYPRLDAAVRAVGSGAGTIVVSPGRYPDCAVLTAGRVTIRAARPGTAVFGGGACEGKATIVARGTALTVDGLVFDGVRVPDRNGAGIRMEGGDVTVLRTTFRNAEQGILTANDASGALVVRWSTFSGLGGCPDGMCSHSIYANGPGRVTVTNSRFERGTGGHYVKVRSPQVLIADNTFDDTGGRETNYMIDLPAGARGEIARNLFVQGPNKENHSTFIAVAAENRDNRSAGLVIRGNIARLAPAVPWPTVFVADWSGETLALGPNTLGARIRPFERR